MQRTLTSQTHRAIAAVANSKGHDLLFVVMQCCCVLSMEHCLCMESLALSPHHVQFLVGGVLRRVVDDTRRFSPPTKRSKTDQKCKRNLFNLNKRSFVTSPSKFKKSSQHHTTKKSNQMSVCHLAQRHRLSVE